MPWIIRVRHLLFLLPRLNCCVARSAKFIILGKQRGNKCWIVVTGICLRKGCLQRSAFSCGTQAHLTSRWKEQKKGESSRKQGSPKFPMPMLLHLRTFSYTTSCTQNSHCWHQRHSNSENHTGSECLVYILAKCPWHKYDSLRWKSYRTTTSEVSFLVCKNHMCKIVSFEKLSILSQGSVSSGALSPFLGKNPCMCLPYIKV